MGIKNISNISLAGENNMEQYVGAENWEGGDCNVEKGFQSTMEIL